MNDQTKRNKGSSITRVLEILETISEAKHPPSPLDLSLALDIPKPSIHRLLQLLEKEGYIKVDIYGGILAGPRIKKMLFNVWDNEKFRIERISILENLSKKIGETCGLAILQDNHMLYVDRVQTNWPLQVYLPIGAKVPLWCTSSGKLLLSFLTTEKRANVLRNIEITQYTKNTIIDIDALEEDIKTISQTRLGTDNEEFIAGMVACSVPILHPNGEIIGCLYTHAPTIRKSLADLMAYEKELRNAANDLNIYIKNSME
ncbi:IclR family transcriptional regulator [Acinetobacter baumannii]|uniref:IclR family transcriptional regulator n=1 Tax=Acinetobacter baumannii TaxID=470 RepID=UPI00234160D3|nr:IclR family transcriptional regulator [Acinetobacter baumannii]MDC4769529.1 IclR family transcriptional regulator [Acinetobacter baumannii]MDC5025016.1 IclR family transcriptional regulator [Acinetobacter baumannii]MDC5067091.1 IclR family transcriptional regulator [Acinetobacter baumannii]MDC5504215.1 IclR family transcriptional regulator [Acinetobacter baumannii]MDH2629749.1 IclR family transcriptional regulator [Acinetobacter baumannii]